MFSVWIRVTAIAAALMLQLAGARADVIIYLSTKGDDKASGLKENEPVGTLPAAVRRAISAESRPGEHVRILAGGGVYQGQGVTIRDMPPDRPLTISAKDGEKPVFDGAGKVRTWLVLDSSTGKPTRLTVHGLEVTNYVTAISLNGDRASTDMWNGQNIIRSMNRTGFRGGLLA